MLRAGPLLRARFEDEAAPFVSPRPAEPLTSMPGGVGEAPEKIGGLGLWLVRHYVHDYHRRRRGGANLIYFSMQPSANVA
jgi:hypothetical protein